MEIKEYFNHNDLVDFYISRGIEFNDNKEYFHPPVFSYVAIIDEKIVGAITICKEENDYILDEVAVLSEKENLGIGTALISTVIERVKQENENTEVKMYLVAKIPDFWKAKGFNIITREEAPGFSECFECPEYFNKTCQPEIMLKKIR